MMSRRLLLMTLLFAAPAGLASAGPITLSLDSISVVGAALPVTQRLFPPIGGPVTGAVGSSNIDFGMGTGTLTLPNYFVLLDLSSDGTNDANLNIQNWQQTITAIDPGGNITSTGSGSVICNPLDPTLGPLVCGAVPPTVADWPPADGASLLSSALINPALQTITVVDNSNATAGTVTTFYSYTLVPEPGSAMLAGLGFAGLAIMRRRQRA
jgi:hypothetical protein